MAMTQSPKLYLICALLALSVDLMKGFIDSCSTQPERAPIFSKYANFQFGLKVQFPPDVPNAMHNSNIWLYIILNVSLALRAKALNRIC